MKSKYVAFKVLFSSHNLRDIRYLLKRYFTHITRVLQPNISVSPNIFTWFKICQDVCNLIGVTLFSFQYLDWSKYLLVFLPNYSDKLASRLMWFCFTVTSGKWASKSLTQPGWAGDHSYSQFSFGCRRTINVAILPPAQLTRTRIDGSKTGPNNNAPDLKIK